MLYLLVKQLQDWLVEHGMYGFVRVLNQLHFRALAAAGLAFLLVLLFGPAAIRWLTRKKIGDIGATDAEALRSQANAKANTPTMGGILIVGAVIVSTLLLADIAQRLVYVGLVVALWLAVLGGFDDWLKLTASSRGAGSRQGLYAWEKLIFQLGVGLLAGWFAIKGIDGGINAAADARLAINLPFQKTYTLAPTLNPSLWFPGIAVLLLISTLMIAGMSNAVNITDGMDGLAAGSSAAVCIGLFVIALIAGDQGIAQLLLVPHVPGAGELAVLAGATAGGCLGFLWWNCSPARVFMGDTGALSLGGIIGYIAVVTRQEFVVLLMSGVFLIEIASVMLQVGYFKASGGKRIFRVAPYHHHLQVGGWPEQQIVARLWIISVILVVIALASIKVR